MNFLNEMDRQIKSSSNNNILVQCRICHNEDEESNMEIPCSCSGTLKYAHRNCVQRWCSEKGNTTCEICLQQFTPNYTAPRPPSLFHYGGSPINFGGNYWEISRRDFHNHQFIAMFAADREFLDPDIEYSAPSTRALTCCRIVATIFIVLLVLKHTLQITLMLSEAGEYSLTVFMLLLLGIIGVFVPVHMMVKATMVVQRLQYQIHHSPTRSHEENDLTRSQSRVIHIR